MIHYLIDLMYQGLGFVDSLVRNQATVAPGIPRPCFLLMLSVY